MKRLIVVAAVLTALLVLGSMGHEFGHLHRGGSLTPQAPVASTASRVTVEIRDFDFFPRELTVAAGASITWINRDGVPHDATDVAGDWGSGALKRDQSVTLFFDSPGFYQYHCTIHPNMKATLKVSDRLKGARKATLLARGQSA